MSDMDNFKQDYPDMYARFLQMNNALAGLQKAAIRGDNASAANRTQSSALPDSGPMDELPNMLELD